MASTPTAAATRRRLSHDQYTAAWISPLKVEHIAAIAMLDEEHEPLGQSRHDQNLYTLGHIGKHNIVIAGLHRAGNVPAATVVSQMTMTFHNLRYSLLVGIGGGVPFGEGRKPIRLGDVVVGTPTGTDSGTIQYDHGKAFTGGFERTGSLAAPPAILLAAADALQIRREMSDDDPVWADIRRISTIANRATLRGFAHPGAAKDQLYEADYVHQGEQRIPCEECGCDPSRRIPPPTSTIDDDSDDAGPFVKVHSGTIASGELVVKDAQMRDRLAEKHKVLCFEMEAVGVLSSFPCMVIRGISDYCDSHKNDVWHRFAAAAAAAYARQLFSYIPFSLSASDSLQIPVEEPHRADSRSPHRSSTSNLERPIRPRSSMSAQEEPAPLRETEPPTLFPWPSQPDPADVVLGVKLEQWDDVWKLKKYDQAEDLAREIVILKEKAYGRDHTQTAVSMYNLARALYELEKYDEAEVWLEKIVDKETNMLLLQGMAFRKQKKYSQAEAALKDAVAKDAAAEGEADAGTVDAQFELAQTYEEQSKHRKRERVLRELSASLEKQYGEGDERTADAKHGLGHVLSMQGKDKEAAEVLQQAFEAQLARLGVKSAKTLKTLQLLGRALHKLSRLGEAEDALRKAVDGQLATLGPRHPDTLESLFRLGWTLQSREQYGESETILKRAHEGQTETLGQTHYKTVNTAYQLGETLWNAAKYREAESLLRKVAESRLQRGGVDSIPTLWAFEYLGLSLVSLKEWTKAEQPLRIAAEGWERNRGGEHRETLRSKLALGTALLEQSNPKKEADKPSKLKEAERLTRAVVEVRTRTLARNHAFTLWSTYWLAQVLMRKDWKSKEAEDLMRKLLDVDPSTSKTDTRGAALPDFDVRTFARKSLAELCYRQNRVDEAAEGFEQVVAELSNQTDKGLAHAYTLEAQEFLGCALYKQGKFDRAEKMFGVVVSERTKALGKRHELTEQAARRHRKAKNHL